MKKNHFLLQRAFVYPKGFTAKEPKNCKYHSKFGAWFRYFGGRQLVLMKSSFPDMPDPRTKKADIETGEDLKGE